MLPRVHENFLYASASASVRGRTRRHTIDSERDRLLNAWVSSRQRIALLDDANHSQFNQKRAINLSRHTRSLANSRINLLSLCQIHDEPRVLDLDFRA